MNIVISDSKTGKAYKKKTEQAVFVGKRIGEEIDLSTVGLQGFKARISGGSDAQGFPMKPSLPGAARKAVLLSRGVGFRKEHSGEFRRKTVRGNTVSSEISQLNLVLTNYGDKGLLEALKPAAEVKEEKPESIKEKAIKESLEMVGKAELAEEAKKIKGKVKH